MAGKLATYSYMNSATSILGSDHQISIPSGQGNRVFTIGARGFVQGTNRSRFANLPSTWVGIGSTLDTAMSNYKVDHSRRSFWQGKLQGPGPYPSSPNRGIRQNELSVTEYTTYKVQLMSTGTPGLGVSVIPFVSLSELNKFVAALNDPQSVGWANIELPSLYPLLNDNNRIYDIGYGCPIYQVRGNSWDPIISSVGSDPIYWNEAYIGYFAPHTPTSGETGDYLYFNVSLPQRQSKSMTSIDSVAQFSAAGGGSWMRGYNT